MKRILLSLLMLLCLIPVKAQEDGEMPMLPKDTTFRTGKLSNGLTYYIRKNNYPKNTANFYIFDRVGSAQEEDDQQGLAHFLEHMAFNGSKHFGEVNMMEVLKQMGISRFNAETFLDWTKYFLTEVPTTRKSVIDSCMLVLKDWSNGLLLTDKEIDKERGVIRSEQRERTSPRMRMAEKYFPVIFGGSKYGYRLPIGKMDIVQNFKYQALRDYYHRWYRPDNQAIAVVGDVDVDYIEQQIKTLFANETVPADAPKVEKYPVPANDKAICIYYADKDQDAPFIQLYMKHDDLDDAQKPTMLTLLDDWMTQTIADMINTRLQEISLKADAPFTVAGVQDTYMEGVGAQKALTAIILPKEGKEAEALACVTKELLRARKYGFNASEFARASATYTSKIEKMYNERNTTHNDHYGDEAFNNFIYGRPIVDIESEYQITKMMLPQLPVDAANEYARHLISNGDSNVVVTCLVKDRGQQTAQGEEMLRQALANARTAKIEAYVDNTKQEPLMAALPTKGSIKSQKDYGHFGCKEYTLSNGARVIVKPTDFKADEIVMYATTPGGAGIYGPADYVNADLLQDVSSTYTLNGHNVMDLMKMLSGKNVDYHHTMDGQSYNFTANCTAKDLETMMQLTYLNFTATGKDENTYTMYMNYKSADVKNKQQDPAEAFQDSVNATIYKHNLYYLSIDSARLATASYDRILNMTKTATANAANWTFYFVGDIDEAKLLPLLEQYIASLPAGTEKAAEPKDLRTLFTGNVENHSKRKMVTDRDFVQKTWDSGEQEFNKENMIYSEAIGNIMQTKMMRSIREEAGIAYTPQNHSDFDNYKNKAHYQLLSMSEVKPGTTAQAAQLIEQGIKEVAAGASAEDVENAKKTMLNQADVMERNNGFWTFILKTFDQYGVDVITGYKDAVKAITPQTISLYANKLFLKPANKCTVTMEAEK